MPTSEQLIVLAGLLGGDIIKLHGHKGEPGYALLHSPNPKVRAASNAKYKAAIQSGASSREAQATLSPGTASALAAHLRSGGNKKIATSSGEIKPVVRGVGDSATSKPAGSAPEGRTITPDPRDGNPTPSPDVQKRINAVKATEAKHAAARAKAAEPHPVVKKVDEHDAKIKELEKAHKELAKSVPHDITKGPIREESPTSPSSVLQARRLPSRAEVKHGSKGRPDGAGTEDDPIDVQGDLDQAVRLIHEGKHVRLNQPIEVSTLVDKLAAIARDAKAKGSKAPDVNLCLVSVPGTNLFCYENKDIPRIQMPQLAGEAVPGSDAAGRVKPGTNFADVTDDFIAQLHKDGITLTSTNWKVSEMRASQNELSGPKVAALAEVMASGQKLPGSVFVSRDGYLLDGHHRWAAGLANDTTDGSLGDTTIPVQVVDMDVGEALDYMNAFTKKFGIKSQGITDKFGGGEADKLKKPTPLPDPKVRPKSKK